MWRSEIELRHLHKMFSQSNHFAVTTVTIIDCAIKRVKKKTMESEWEIGKVVNSNSEFSTPNNYYK
ncbi:hypothetical protein TSUD_41940 [Trifolium subterraneum]|nr:hypothetical protein TSUD_41940 [Trifolium subterraneum]